MPCQCQISFSKELVDVSCRHSLIVKIVNYLFYNSIFFSGSVGITGAVVAGMLEIVWAERDSSSCC